MREAADSMKRMAGHAVDRLSYFEEDRTGLAEYHRSKG